MKQWIAWILILVCILSGCSDQPEDNTENPVTTQPKFTEPARSIRWEGSALEESSGGAAVIFSTEDTRISGIGFLDGDPVLLTQREDAAVLTRMDGTSGNVLAEKLQSGSLDGVVMAGNRLAYYDARENAFRILDASFKEISKIKLQQEPNETPLITGDLSQAYYCVGSDIRSMDLQTGISRMVCQRGEETVGLMDLLLGDSILCCLVEDVQGGSYVEFLNAENGITLNADKNILTLDSLADIWLISRLDGTTEEILTGSREGDVYAFTPDAEGSNGLQLLPGGIFEHEESLGKARVRLYDKEYGKCLAQMELEGVEDVYAVVEDPSGQYVWFTCADSLTKQDILVRWDTTASGGADDTVRIAARHTAENPDAAGLAALKQQAQTLGQKYGVQIHIANDIPQAEGFTFTYEYQVEAFGNALETLDRVLAKFPEGFLTTAANRTKDGRLHIGLVRGLQPNTADGNPEGDGLHYLHQDSAWITLCVGEGLERSFYHNLSHALDTYVYSNSIHYDFWSSCNPEGFQYDGSYLHVDAHAGSPYLSGRSRAFIDAFSMTFAHEDRATVFAYAMMEDTSDYFDSTYMQAKLKQLSMGIREAFGWEEQETVFPWEQYLKIG